MTSRILGAAGVGVGVLAGVLAGCGQVPAPGPTPTATAAFASEEEAFAAAEEVYRAYNEAENSQRTGDPAAVDPEDFLVGPALENYIDGQDLLRFNNLRLEGEILIMKFVPSSDDVGSASPEISAAVCLDVSGTRTIDTTSGIDLTSPTRSPVIAQEVTLIYGKDRFLIEREAEGDASTCVQH